MLGKIFFFFFKSTDARLSEEPNVSFQTYRYVLPSPLHATPVYPCLHVGSHVFLNIPRLLHRNYGDSEWVPVGVEQ